MNNVVFLETDYRENMQKRRLREFIDHIYEETEGAEQKLMEAVDYSSDLLIMAMEGNLGPGAFLESVKEYLAGESQAY